MGTDQRLETIAAALETECADDYVGPWAVLWEVKRAFPERGPDHWRAATMRAVAMVLGSGRVVLGELDDRRHFVRWPGSREVQVARILDTWSELGRDPDIGEVVWLAPAQTP